MDSFLYTFTILPLRILLVLYTVTVKFISNFRHEEKRYFYFLKIKYVFFMTIADFKDLFTLICHKNAIYSKGFGSF